MWPSWLWRREGRDGQFATRVDRQLVTSRPGRDTRSRNGALANHGRDETVGQALRIERRRASAERGEHNDCTDRMAARSGVGGPWLDLWFGGRFVARPGCLNRRRRRTCCCHTTARLKARVKTGSVSDVSKTLQDIGCAVFGSRVDYGAGPGY